MRPSTVLRLALAGSRTDVTRVVLTAISAGLATLTLLAAATVASISGVGVLGRAPRYGDGLLAESGSRFFIVLILVSLTIPVVTLAAQCTRLGGPARDRRLATFRLAGATPRQVVAVAATETGLASLLGSAAGLASYLVVRTFAHRPDPRGFLALPTDIQLAPWLILLACVVGPLLSLGLAALLMGRVMISPFGLVRRARTVLPRWWPRVPHWWPLILLAEPLVALLLIGPQGLVWPRLDVPADVRNAVQVGAVLGGLACACAGIGLSAGWIAYTGGRILGAVARRPSTLVAGRRLTDDPWSSGRTFGTLLVAVFGGAFVAGLWGLVDAGRQVQALAARRDPAFPARPDDAFLAIPALVDAAVGVAIVIAAGALLVALVERALAHRRGYAALVAGGVPRSVLYRAAIWQVVVPIAPALLLALGAGLGFGRLTFGERYNATLPGLPCQDLACGEHPVTELSVALPLPWEQLALIGGGSLVAVLGVAGLSLLFLRSGTDPAELRAA